MGKKPARNIQEVYFTKDHEMVRKAVADFVKKEINPYVDEWEEQGKIPLHDLFKKMADLGFLGISHEQEYGGEGLDLWYETVFLEELGQIDALGVPLAILVQTFMATPAIKEFGSDYLKEKYLKGAISGDLVSAIGITEPDAGSDVSALKTTARREGDYYIVNGSKTFITNGTQADFVTTLVRTSDDPGYHCFSLLVIPTDLPGFQVSKKLDKLGMRCSDTAELFFDNMKVPAENLIGNEGEGFIYQMQQFQHERFCGIPMSYIAAKKMVDQTANYIKERIVFGKPLINKQVLQHRLADWLTEIEFMRSFTYHLVTMKMAGLDITKYVSMGKLNASRMCMKIADGCLQMHGGMGLMNEMAVSRYYRDVRLSSIGGGADEIMKDIIVKQEGYV